MFTIRKATGFDAKAIFDLRSRAILQKCAGYYSEEQLVLWTQGEVSAAFAQDVAENFYVSELNAQVIGSGKINLTTGMLDAIFVDPSQMGQGAAKNMLEYLQALGLEQGLSALKLESTLNAAPFYRRCGFMGDEQATYLSPRGMRLACIPMEKPLSPNSTSKCDTDPLSMPLASKSSIDKR
jgi:N-acetylglutamate synthase-like GNAT family acetyltransferase